MSIRPSDPVLQAPTSRAVATSPGSWRVVDMVVAATLGVAFGVIFWAWNLLWNSTSAAFSAFPPAQAVLYGIWLIPGVLGGALLRRHGSALFVAFFAAVVSALLGSSWGLIVLVYGVVQGLAPELVFLATRYRHFGLPTLMMAGALTGAGAAWLDIVNYYPDWTTGWMASYVAILMVGGALVAGVGSWVLQRALRSTGVLSALASGKPA